MYNEYFNYKNCSVSYVYTNAINTCITAHYNYMNTCSTTHSNANNYCITSHANALTYCATTYVNFSNYCATTYVNTTNACSVYHSNSNNACSTYYTNRIGRYWQYGNSSYYCSTTYKNTANYCSTSHVNSNNTCATSHVNGINTCATAYVNYDTNCATAHTNAINYCATTHNNTVNDCSTTKRYVNTVNYSLPNSGKPQTLTWGDGWDDDNLASDAITGNIDAIKDIRDNIAILGTTKSQNTTTITISESVDSKFDDNDTETTEKIRDELYSEIRNNLEALWTDIKGETLGLTTATSGTQVKKSDWSNLKKKTDELASFDDSVAYSNTMTYVMKAYTNHSNTCTTST